MIPIAAGLAAARRVPIWGYALAAALVFAGIQTIRIEGFWFIRGYKDRVAVLRIDLDAARAERDAEAARHLATKQAYREAQAEAARLEKARLASVLAQQKDITDAISADYSKRLAAARAAADRLRAEALQGRSGSAGSPGSQSVPGMACAAGGTDEAPCGDGLSDAQRLIATEQAIQLDSLITWVERMSGIDPNANIPTVGE